MNWWLSSGEKTEGPFPEEHVVEWLRTGRIQPDTMACPEGGQEWKRLSEMDEFSKLVPPPSAPSVAPPPPPCPGPRPASPQAVVGPANYRRANFGILTASIVLCSVGLFLEFVDVLVVDLGPLVSILWVLIGLGGLATWLIFHYQLWAIIPERHAETTPGKAVGYLFIPFYNFYWVFQSYCGVARSLNRLAESSGVHECKANIPLATAYSVMAVVGIVLMFFAGVLIGVAEEQGDLETARGIELCASILLSIPELVFWLLMVLNQKRMVENLLAHNVPVNTSSGLLERYQSICSVYPQCL